MRSSWFRIVRMSPLAVALALLPAGLASSQSTQSQSDRLVILSTTDVKGKTSPCGCSTPRGGLSRRASFADSIRSAYGQVMLVDNGYFFPEVDTHQDVAGFLMDAMKVLGTDAVGLSEKELRWGVDYLKGQIKRTGVPVVSANLLEATTKKPVVQPYVIKKVGTVRVGVFSLMSDKVELGPSAVSLKVEEPSAAARRTVAELRKKGATVVVLLSQLGKVESEDLSAAIPGIDVVIVGHNVPMIQKGRMIKNPVACYGGEQGQYIGRTIVTLDAARKMSTGENEVFMLGPEVGERPEMVKLVKAFEDGFNEKQRKLDKERAAQRQQEAAANADHFLGAELCMRCHVDEAEQWKTTSHSQAWQTLVEVKKDATPDCIPCHVVGYKQPGGFQSQSDAPKLVNVQCENCHGMGTLHDAFATTPHKITQETCIKCHQGENDPAFSWEKKLPMIAHGNTSGETIKNKKFRRANGSTMMKGHSSNEPSRTP